MNHSLQQPQQQHQQKQRQPRRISPAVKGASNGVYKKQAAASGRAAGTTCALKADWLKRLGKNAIASSLPQKQRIWLENLGNSKEVDHCRLRCKFCKVEFDYNWDNVALQHNPLCLG